MKSYCMSQVLTCREEFVRAATDLLLNAPRLAVSNLKPSMIPAEAGVYIFYKFGETRPFHVGESRNLRQRIYMNQLRGQVNQSATAQSTAAHQRWNR